jgi:hypothetical protein
VRDAKAHILYEHMGGELDNLYRLFLAVSRAALIAQFGGAAVAPPEPADRPMQTGTDPHVVAGFLNLAGLRQPLLNYANNNRGRLPLDLGLLYPFYVNDPNVFRNPRGATPPAPAGMTTDQTRAWINAQSDYVYLGAGRGFSAAPVLMYESPAEMELGINILFNDGRVEFREMSWALETIAAAKARMGV